MIHTFVMHSKATRKVPNAVIKVNSFLFLLRILKSSVSPVMTASMPPIWTHRTQYRRKRRFKCESFLYDVFTLLICWLFLFPFYQDFHYVFLSTRYFPHKLVTKQVLQHHVLGNCLKYILKKTKLYLSRRFLVSCSVILSSNNK